MTTLQQTNASRTGYRSVKRNSKQATVECAAAIHNSLPASVGPVKRISKLQSRAQMTTEKSSSEPSQEQFEKKDKMILEYFPLVKYVASRIATRLPRHVEIGDLINSGVIGLIDAIDKFDESHKVKFKTYAEFRIRGAILDELRKLDWVPRSTRRKASKLERAYRDLGQRLGRAASDAEMIEFLDISIEAFDHLVYEARNIALISLDELQGHGHDDGGEHNLLENLADEGTLSASEVMNMDQVYQIVGATIDQLAEKERLVISLYYYEKLTMQEIADILSLTESRISQIHTKAILRLRGRLLNVIER